jgi:hypothetical protein
MGILQGARERDPSISAVAVTPALSFEFARQQAVRGCEVHGSADVLAERI